MSPYDIKELKILNTLQGMTLYQLDFERGLRLIADRFIIYLVDGEKEVIIEGKANFRVRDDEKMYLAFNDLYTEKSRKKEISVRSFRSQKHVEKTYLSVALETVNEKVKGRKVIKVQAKPYGDLYVHFDNGIVFEIIHDCHIEETEIFTIINKNTEREYTIINRDDEFFIEDKEMFKSDKKIEIISQKLKYQRENI